jgi:RNA polymerase sigma-70 factor, ECF subfamily
MVTASGEVVGTFEAVLGPLSANEPAVVAAFDAAVAAGQAAWPTVRLSQSQFAEYLAARIATPLDPAAPFGTLAITDLYLACGCTALDPKALEACDGLLSKEATVAADVARMHASVRDEALQIVRTALFAPRTKTTAAIHDYAGRGSLRGWFRVMLSRELVRLVRAQQRGVELEDELAGADYDDDPVLAELKARYRGELADAFRTSLDELPPRDRTLLRYQLIDGLTIDEIGSIYRVHRATAARWLVGIRDVLVEETRSRLGAKLGVDTCEAASIVRLVQSQLDVSVLRHLGPLPRR